MVAPGLGPPQRARRLPALDVRLDVVLDLVSGGARCCSIEQIFSFDPRNRTYKETQHNFAIPGSGSIGFAAAAAVVLISAG